MKRGVDGVTLIEVAIVMAIIAFMGVCMSPAIGEWLDNYRIRQAARDIVSTLNVAKVKAISRRLEYRVYFDVANNQYRLWMNDGGWVPDPEEGIFRTPRGVVISGATGNLGSPPKVKFNPDGTCSNGHITIDNGRGKQYDVVFYYTGRIRIEEP